MRTTEYIITGETSKVTTGMGEISRPFNIFISESGTSVQNAFIELSGISDPIASQAIRLKVNSQIVSEYSINASTYPTPFTILHKINSGDLNTFTNGTSSNTLYITAVNADASIISAKIIVTYYYTTQ
ncbi:hypothetical protein HZA55_00195 [Candidatus Poribacteria bacterium]|nr:hypothetical protein [Candidatus Poribacteria bacterium]